MYRNNGRKKIIDMYYSEMVKKAVNIMFEAHKEDFDKGGYPYVFYPFYLATKVDGENETCVALLHDVVEDHGDKYSFEYLENEGFNKEIIDALKLLTHKKDVPYMDYIVEISKNNIAKAVKDTDLHKKYNYVAYLLVYINIKYLGSEFNLDGKIKATNFVQKKGGEHTLPNLVASPVMKHQVLGIFSDEIYKSLRDAKKGVE